MEGLMVRLELLRKDMGESQERFARRLGVNPATYSLVRRGKRRLGRAIILGAREAFPGILDGMKQDGKKSAPRPKGGPGERG